MRTITKKLIHVFLTLSMLAYCAMPVMAADANRNAYQPIPAVSAEYIFHSNNEGEHIGNNNVQSILRYENVDFGTDTTKMLTKLCFEIAMDAAGGTIDVYMDSTDETDATAVRNSGKKLAAITTENTHGWGTWEVQGSTDIAISKVTGVHTLYVLFNSSLCGNVKSFYFEQGDYAETVKWTLDQEIPAVKYDDILTSVNNGTYIGMNNSGYIRYDGVDFGSEKKLKELGVEVGVPSDVADRKLSVYILNEGVETTAISSRQDIVDNGTEIASIKTVPTGGWSQFAWQYSTTVTPDVTGVHSIYIIFQGNYTGNLKTLLFSTERKVNAFEKIEAESADKAEGCTINGTNIGGTNHNSWAEYQNIDFSAGTPNYCVVNAAAPSGYANGTVEVYADNMDAGSLVASVKLKETMNWDAYEKNYVELDETAKAKLNGTKVIYLKFLRGDGAVLGNIDSFLFVESFNNAYAKPLYGEDAADWDSALAQGIGEYNGEKHTKFGATNSGRWILFENVDFGEFPAKEFSMIYGAPEQTSADGKANAKINVYIDNMVSAPIYSDLAENTGGYGVFKECGPYAITSEITGLHDVYVSFGYSGTCDFMGIAFTSSVDGLAVVENSLALSDIDGNDLPNGQILTSNVDFIEASCTIANNTQENAEATIILAAYTPDGRLAGIAVNSDVFAPGSVTPLFSTYIDFASDTDIKDTTGYLVKAMVWNGLEGGMTPLPGGSL